MLIHLMIAGLVSVRAFNAALLMSQRLKQNACARAITIIATAATYGKVEGIARDCF
jgi:hypothetical protein